MIASRRKFAIRLIVLFGIGIGYVLLRSFVFATYKIPSSAMLPTLQVGDFIAVNKLVYGLRVPILNKKILDLGAPKRGDIFVFEFPGGGSSGRMIPVGTALIKRCVGLPGDKITYSNHQLTINGVEVKTTEIGHYAPKGQSGRNLNDMTAIAQEHLPGQAHQIVWFGSQAPPNALDGEWTVPAGMYFAMGDNRDNSADSRDWGFVPEANLIGRVDAIWMNFDTDQPGWIAWKRLFTSPN
jgi:signal peptidase I